VKIETLPQYAMDLEKGDHMASFDIKSSYRHFRLAPRMRDWFCFRYDGRFLRCIALPFGWGRSPQVVHAVSLSSCPTSSHGTVVQSIGLHRRLYCAANRSRNSGKISRLQQGDSSYRQVRKLGSTKHPTKGEWIGTTRIEHLERLWTQC
jgi:hypothetical protein